MKASTFTITPEQEKIVHTLRSNHPRKLASLLERICCDITIHVDDDDEYLLSVIKRRSPDRWISANSANVDETCEITIEIRETRLYTVPLSSMRLPDDAVADIAKHINSALRPRHYEKRSKSRGHWLMNDYRGKKKKAAPKR